MVKDTEVNCWLEEPFCNIFKKNSFPTNFEEFEKFLRRTFITTEYVICLFQESGLVPFFPWVSGVLLQIR